MSQGDFKKGILGHLVLLFALTHLYLAPSADVAGDWPGASAAAAGAFANDWLGASAAAADAAGD